jgi:hypothetical protein
MQKPEFIGAFQIAADRNQDIDKVKQSLINAGYDIQDVEDSALAFSQGMTKPVAKPLPALMSMLQAPSVSAIKEMPKYLLIAIIASAAIVLGLIGYVAYRLLSG